MRSKCGLLLRCFGLVWLSAIPLRALQQLNTDEPNWKAVCEQALAQPLPPQAAALAAAAQADQSMPQPCDETKLYYGFSDAPNYGGALRCAYRQRVKPFSAVGDFVWGPGTLTMLYANGYGVTRNYDLAIRFACEQAPNSADAETEGRIGRLEALQGGKLSSGTVFDLCDDATSGAMASSCEYIRQTAADVKRTRELVELKARLPQAAQFELPALKKAENAFEQAREHGEYTGGGGSGTASFVELDQGQLREQFVINLQRFASGQIPPATAAVRRRTEGAMRAASAAAQDFTPDPQAWSQEPTPQSLAAVQQAWQQLYEEWLRFLPLAYPKLSQDAALTELLRLRIHQLRKATPNKL